MHGFVRNFITEWRRLELPFSGETVVVAVSGGADSVSLLLAVHDLNKRKKLNHRIVAAHFNHNLRGDESTSDEDYVRGLTRELGVELAVGQGDLHASGNVEENARNARYAFLARTAENLKAFAILTGHTINDQAETFLMNLLRGSGPDGLAGMLPVRKLEGEKRGRGEEEKGGSSPSSPLLVRPLLTWTKRIDTEAFCHDIGVEYRYDTMNEDTAFKRVRIRKILLPLLEDFNPKIIETLANTAALMQNVPQMSGLRNQLPFANELKLGDLKELTKPERCEIIRGWLLHQRGTTRQLELKHIEAIERLLFSPKSGKVVELPGGRVTKSEGKLVYDENKVEN